MRTPIQTGSDLMSSIEHLVAAGIPRTHLIELAADLMRAGKEARRVEASVADLKSWCCGCLHDHPDCFAPLTARGMPVEMMISLSNNLASLGWCARACSVSDSFRDLVIELVLAGRRAEPPRSAAGLRPAPRHTGAGVAMGRR